MSNFTVSPDFITIVTNVGVFLAASGTVIAAIWSAVRKIKTVGDTSSQMMSSRVAGGMIMDNTTLLMLSESNRDVTEAVRELHKETMELRFAVIQLKDVMK